MRAAIACILIGLSLQSTAAAASSIKVVTTLSTFADLVKTIGGDKVDVKYIASPKFNPHFIQPRPSDVLRVKKAKVFVHAGLDLEAWRGPLLNAAGNRNVNRGSAGEIDLSTGIPLLEVPDRKLSRAEGDIHLFGNPHYWVNPENAKTMVATITQKLSALSPKNAKEFEQNRAAFVDKLDAKIKEWKQALKPYADSELVGYHNEWPYLMEFAGLKMDLFLEPKPGVPPTPKHLDLLINYIKDNNIRGIVQSVYFPSSASKSLAKRTGAKIILLSQNVGETKKASDYIAMMDDNVKQLVAAFEKN